MLAPKKLNNRILILTIFGSLCCGCVPLDERANCDNNLDIQSRSVEYISVPDNWATYTYKGRFRFSVPPTMELKLPEDPTVQKFGYWYPAKNDSDEMHFVFKGRSNEMFDMNKHYCYISASIGTTVEQLGCHDTIEITATDVELIIEQKKQEMQYLSEYSLNTNPSSEELRRQSGQIRLIELPKVRWIDVHGIKALEISYSRTAWRHFTTKVIQYKLFNNCELASITVAYRIEEAELWKDDLEYVIQTFDWINK